LSKINAGLFQSITARLFQSERGSGAVVQEQRVSGSFAILAETLTRSRFQCE